jgi:hypothetical protein
MKRLQLLVIAVGVVVLALVFAQPVKATIQTQQAQIAINIVVQVSGTPVGYVPHQAPAGGQPIVSSIALRRATPALQRAFRAEALQFDPAVVAQAQVQKPLLVQAEVTPNPKATILISNSPSVTIPAAPGQTVTLVPACSLTVTVNMTTAWSLEEGITSDFASGFPGKDLANDTYKNSATPQPKATPYIVYADDGKVWSGLASGTTITTYCVDLTVTVPVTVPDGTYVTNAVYTLFN